MKAFWKPNNKPVNDKALKPQNKRPIYNGQYNHVQQANTNQNNSNMVNGVNQDKGSVMPSDSLEPIQPEVTPDGYGLRTPYGTHLNLDFLKYCEDIASGRNSQQYSSFRRPRTASTTSRSRQARLSMNAPSNESLDSLASDITSSSEAGQVGDADRTLMETRRRLEAFRSFRTKRKQQMSPPDKLMPTPIESTSSSNDSVTSPTLSSGQVTPNSLGGIISSINNLSSPQHFQAVREQLVAALKRLKEVENQVKQIPVLQVQLSVLQQEKRNLTNTLRQTKDTLNSYRQQSITAPQPLQALESKENIQNSAPPPPPKRRYHSMACGDNIPINNIVCYATECSNNAQTLLPIKQFTHVSTTSMGPTLFAKAVQADIKPVYRSFPIQVDFKSDQKSLSTQANLKAEVANFGTQFYVNNRNIGSNTEPPKIPVMCSVSQNTDPSPSKVMHDKILETIKITTKETGTETMKIIKPALVDTSVGNHVLYVSTHSGPCHQMSLQSVPKSSQTDDVTKLEFVDACVGNYVEQETKAVGVKSHTKEVSTNMNIIFSDACIGDSISTKDEAVQAEKPTTTDIGILASRSSVTFDVGCGNDFVIEYSTKEIDCKPLVEEIGLDSKELILSNTVNNSIGTDTDNNELGGSWSSFRETKSVSLQTVIDIKTNSTCTEPLLTVDKASATVCNQTIDHGTTVNILPNTNDFQGQMSPKMTSKDSQCSEEDNKQITSVDKSTSTLSHQTSDCSTIANILPITCDLEVQSSVDMSNVASQCDDVNTVSENKIETSDRSTSANILPKTCDVDVQNTHITSHTATQYDYELLKQNNKLHSNYSLPHVKVSSGDHLHNEILETVPPVKYVKPIFVSIGTNTDTLEKPILKEEVNNSTNEIEQYVEKVNSLLEEQQSLLASQFGDFDVTDGSENNTGNTREVTFQETKLNTFTVNGDLNTNGNYLKDLNGNKREAVIPGDQDPKPRIKSIMRKPGTPLSEKKFLRFAEGVKSDDDSSSDEESSEDELDECNSGECNSDCDSDCSSGSNGSETGSSEEQSSEPKSTFQPINNNNYSSSTPIKEDSTPIKEEPLTPEVKISIRISKEKYCNFRSCITDSFLNACDIVDKHMNNPRSVSKKDLEEATTLLGSKWMSVAAQPDSSAYQVEEFVDKLSETSLNLLRKVVNLTDASGNTALHYAISHGKFTVVSSLLDIEALDVNRMNQAGYTAAMLAALSNANTPSELEALRKLFKTADVNSHAKQAGQTALMLAVSHGRTMCAEALLQAGASVNAQDEDGSTALMCATEHGHVDLVKKLLAQADCDASIKDHDGSTALSIAMDSGHRDIAILLYAQMNFSKSKIMAKQSSPRNDKATSPSLKNSLKKST